MKYLVLALALVFVGAQAQEHPPDRGAVPCFYWDEECTSSYGVDFPGNDIAIYRTNSTADCCNFCKSFEGCMHWVARLVDDGGYVCFLKSLYGFPRYCAECTFSYAKSEACKGFCESTCHNLEQFGPAVCGTDGYTYESPCQMQCSAVMQAAEGECDSPFRDPVDPDPTLSTFPIDPTQYPYLPTSDAAPVEDSSLPEKPEGEAVEAEAAVVEGEAEAAVVEGEAEAAVVEGEAEAAVVEGETAAEVVVEGGGEAFVETEGTAAAGGEAVTLTNVEGDVSVESSDHSDGHHDHA